MEVFYINLAEAVERNERFVRSFVNSNFPSGWRLNRFEAISGRSPRALAMPGVQSANQKGAYLSHLECVRLSCGTDCHTLIAEDDTEFCHLTEVCLSSLIGQLPEESWDVIFTDIYIPNALDMPKVLKLRRNIIASNTIRLFNTRGWSIPYAGAGSYVINRRSKQKFLQAMKVDELNAPYDILLRDVTREQALTGFLTIPFLTTVSETANISQHGPYDPANELMHLFRRLIWLGSDDPVGVRRDAEKLWPGRVGDDMAAMAAIMAPLLALQMEWSVEDL